MDVYHFGPRDCDLYLKLRGENLPVKDSWLQGGKADPYVVLRKGHGMVYEKKKSCFGDTKQQIPYVAPVIGEYMGDENEAIWVYNGKNNHQRNTLNPDWPNIVVALNDLCDGPRGHLMQPVVVDIWDYDFECPHDDFMGFCLPSIFDLFVARLRNTPIPLLPGKAGHSWGGHLIVEDIQVRPIGTHDHIDSRTILHYVCAEGDVGLAQILLGLNSEPNPVHEQTAVTMATPLHFVVMGGAKEGMGEEQTIGFVELFGLLLEAKADPRAKDREGMTPFCRLAKMGDSSSFASRIIKKIADCTPAAPVRNHPVGRRGEHVGGECMPSAGRADCGAAAPAAPPHHGACAPCVVRGGQGPRPPCA